MYLLDTNILSELIKKTPNENLIHRLDSVPAPSLCTAGVCIMELRYGALRVENRPGLWERIQENIVSKLQILSFGYKEALSAAEILVSLHTKGRPIGVEDVMIGAVALGNGLAVITANTKHLSQISGLTVENWLLPHA
jgi:predicted nucleic acid-binding protein